MADVTGKICRNICHLLWVCTLGFNDGPPHEDSMAQIFLLTDHVNSVLCGINRSYDDTVPDEADVDQLQK